MHPDDIEALESVIRFLKELVEDHKKAPTKTQIAAPEPKPTTAPKPKQAIAPKQKPEPKPKTARRKKLTRIRRSGEELAVFRAEIRAKRARGVPVERIAKTHGVSTAYVYQLGE